MLRQVELVEKVKSYDPKVDEDALNRAYVFAMKAHGSQTRASGDPYFSHPVQVAGILADMKLDTASIITALLHDVVEDTPHGLKEIEEKFGPEIVRLVDGVTKLSKIDLQSDHTKQAENFRKLVLAMSSDIRVLLVKLADRLHNMRTLYHIKSAAKRRLIAMETSEIYAPLAERMGLQEMRKELDDLAFGELYPDVRESIVARLNYLRKEGSALVDQIIKELEGILQKSNIGARIFGREKMPHSIWRKMQRKAVGFEQLSDIMAFRIVVGSTEDCYRVLGIIHGLYPMVPGRFKDYISTPKLNGYRSLHTTVIGPLKQRIEVQIRSEEMDEVAEMGIAAHWCHTDNEQISVRDGRQYLWLRELLDVMEHAASPEEFLEHTKLEMFRDQVFCFTPKGDLIVLPAGASGVDFAYAVHTEVGNTCSEIRINGRPMPFQAHLSNGDQVEVICDKSSEPSPLWENYVITGKARTRIRRYIRSHQRAEFELLGRNILEKSFERESVDFSESLVARVLGQFGCKTLEDLYASVGQGLHTGREIIHAVYPSHKTAHGESKVIPLAKAREREKGKKTGPAVLLKGLKPGLAVHYGGCCHPLPGDRIVGVLTGGKGVTVHTIDCKKLDDVIDQPERWLDIAWETPKGADAGPSPYVGRINVILANQPGSLGSLSTMIGDNDSNITNLSITRRSNDFFEMGVDLEVRDVKHLLSIIATLRTSPVINSVERARG